MNGLHDLLSANARLHRLGPEYGGDEQGIRSNTNHGPMSAEVIMRRGPPDEVMATLADLVDAATLRFLRVGRRAPVLIVHIATAPNQVLHGLAVLPRHLCRRACQRRGPP